MMISDEMIICSAEKACEIYLDSIDKEFANAPDYAVSLRFKRRMRKLIKEQNRTPQERYLVNVMRKAAVFFIVLLIGMATLVVSVEAYRVRFINYVKKITGRATTYKYFIENTPYLNADLSDIEIRYIPEAFYSIAEQSDERHFYAHYSNTSGCDFSIELTYVDSSSSGFISIDTEGSELKNISINRNAAVLNKKEDEKQLIWSINNVLCQIAGNIEEEEIIHIAESIIVYFKNE